MAERIDSVHIKIKIDVDEEDKQFQQQLASNMERADQQQVKRKTKLDEEEKEEKLTKGTKRRRKVIPKDDPTEIEIKKLEKEISEINAKLSGKKPKNVKELEKELKDKKDRLILKQINEGPLKKFSQITNQQAKNLMTLITKPATFVNEAIAAAFARYGKAAGGGFRVASVYGALGAFVALIAWDVFEAALKSFMQPGRWLDRRFKRIAAVETLNFYTRQLQEELRHGYQEIRVFTRQGLRGGASQVNGNLFEFSSGTTTIIQSSPFRSSAQIIIDNTTKGIATDRNGNPSQIFNSRRLY